MFWKFSLRLGDVRKKQINELFGCHDRSFLKVLSEMLSVAGHEVVGVGSLGAFQESVVRFIFLDF
jgi:hypothetical protein